MRCLVAVVAGAGVFLLGFAAAGCGAQLKGGTYTFTVTGMSNPSGTNPQTYTRTVVETTTSTAMKR